MVFIPPMPKPSPSRRLGSYSGDQCVASPVTRVWRRLGNVRSDSNGIQTIRVHNELTNQPKAIAGRLLNHKALPHTDPERASVHL